jgi:hypothetical protein
MKSRLWNNPIGILVAIRDRRADDWSSLCQLCKCDPDEPGTATIILAQHISTLIQLGLITHFEDVTNKKTSRYYRFPDGKFAVTKLVEALQSGLGLSLKAASLLNDDFSMVVRPRFGLPSGRAENIDIFVLMPFTDSLKPVYEDHIKGVAKTLGLTVSRADDFFTNKSIVEDIWEAINAAKTIVADCTGRNPNVFYEMGIAHVLGKPIIPITQIPGDIPFDIEHLRYIQYEYTPRGMTKFEQDLAKAVEQIQSELDD